MSIDLDSTEGRKEYLANKLDDLLEGINDSYGTLLMEELLNRLELTVKDFNEEMKVLCEQLVVKEKERQQFLEMLKTTDNMMPEQSIENKKNQDENKNLNKSQTVIHQTSVVDKVEEDIPEWEKKLAKLEKGR